MSLLSVCVCINFNAWLCLSDTHNLNINVTVITTPNSSSQILAVVHRWSGYWPGGVLREILEEIHLFVKHNHFCMKKKNKKKTCTLQVDRVSAMLHPQLNGRCALAQSKACWIMALLWKADRAAWQWWCTLHFYHPSFSASVFRYLRCA